MAYSYGMTPNEFYDCTYKDVLDYVEYNSLQREKELKNQINLFEAVSDKIISATKWKKPKYISLVRDYFKDLFKKELEKKPQTIEEQLRVLKSWNNQNLKEK